MTKDEWGRPGLSKRTALALRSKIFAGEYKAGERLPSEPALAREFGVSRDTVRSAVTELTAELLVERRRGIGTFVRDRGSQPSHGLERLVGVNEAIRSLSLVPSTTDLVVDRLAAPAALVDPFGLAPGTPLVRVRRTVLADDRPVLRVTDWVPESVLPEPDAQDRSTSGVLPLADFAPTGSLSRTLAQLGLVLGSAMAWVLPVLPDAELAGYLQVAQGTPLLRLRQIHYEAAPPHRAVLYSDQRWNTELLPLHILRRA